MFRGLGCRVTATTVVLERGLLPFQQRIRYDFSFGTGPATAPLGTEGPWVLLLLHIKRYTIIKRYSPSIDSNHHTNAYYPSPPPTTNVFSYVYSESPPFRSLTLYMPLILILLAIHDAALCHVRKFPEFFREIAKEPVPKTNTQLRATTYEKTHKKQTGPHKNKQTRMLEKHLTCLF